MSSVCFAYRATGSAHDAIMSCVGSCSSLSCSTDLVAAASLLLLLPPLLPQPPLLVQFCEKGSLARAIKLGKFNRGTADGVGLVSRPI